MDEFAVLKKYLPLETHLSKYLTIRTKINCFDDLDFRMAVQLARTVHKFSHTGWTELKDLVVGIKCYTKHKGPASFWVKHTDKKQRVSIYIDEATVANEVWHQFKYPFLDDEYTETRIFLSDEVTAFTLAIMNTATRVRHDAGINELPGGYTSIGTKAVVYVNKAGRPLLPEDTVPPGVEQVLVFPCETNKNGGC